MNVNTHFCSPKSRSFLHTFLIPLFMFIKIPFNFIRKYIRNYFNRLTEELLQSPSSRSRSYKNVLCLNKFQRLLCQFN